MRDFRSFTLVTCLAIFVGAPLTAQNTLSAPPPVQTVTLGHATVPLTGPWKFHIGDNMAWVQPDFDDSSWGTMDLTPPPGSYDPIIGSSGFVPGWTTHGYKGYSGYAWYRQRVDIQNGQSALALKMPDNVDDAYQIYVNGKLIGEFGRFTAHGITAYNAQPRAFPLPANLRNGVATIAIRFWMNAYTALVDPDVGGLHGPPVLGETNAIGSLLKLDWDWVDLSEYAAFFQSAVLLLALAVAFGLFWLDRKEPAYLWLGLTCAVILVRSAALLSTNYTTWMDGNIMFLIQDAVLNPIVIGLWIAFWAYWFRLPGMARLHRMVWSLVALLGIGMALLRAPLYGSVVPVHAIVWLSPLNETLKLLLGVLLIWVTIRGIRKDKTEGWVALPIVVLVAVSVYQEELIVLHIPAQWFPFGIGLSIGNIGTILSLLIITVLLLRRFLHGQREREQWKLEIEQARQLQQVLIPEALPVVPGLQLESEYRPAQQVGGDFFQVIRDPGDDSLLIVLGDVSGKGLKAAMLVSLMVGAIRTATDSSFDPVHVLRTLNHRLCGRAQSHATCLALRVASDGAATLANAGHLPPYLNGRELPMEGALPLGVDPYAEFSLMHFQLAPGDRLILLTDGVVEAASTTRELFGFARVEAAMQDQKSVVTIAADAQAFGQQDDITVIGIQFVGAPAGVTV